MVHSMEKDLDHWLLLTCSALEQKESYCHAKETCLELLTVIRMKKLE